MKILCYTKLCNHSRSTTLVLVISPSMVFKKIKFYYVAPTFRDNSKSSCVYKLIFIGDSFFRNAFIEAVASRPASKDRAFVEAAKNNSPLTKAFPKATHFGNEFLKQLLI